MSHRYENNKKNNIANANRDDSSMLTIYMEAMNLNSSINASFLSLALDEDRNNVS